MHIETINKYRYHLQNGMMNLADPMDHIMYQIFKIKSGYYPKLLKPETMKLAGSTKSKITKDKNGET